MNTEYEKLLYEINIFVQNKLPMYDDCVILKFVYDKLQNDTIYVKQELSEFYFSFNTVRDLIESIEEKIKNDLFLDSEYNCFVSVVQSKTIVVRSQEHGTEWNEYEYEVLINIK